MWGGAMISRRAIIDKCFPWGVTLRELQQSHTGLQQSHTELQQSHTALHTANHYLTRRLEILEVEKQNLEQALAAMTEMPPLSFSHVAEAPPFLERAAARLGFSSIHDSQAGDFYSWFSEIWPDGYKELLHKQYEAYLPFLPATGGAVLDIGCGAGEFLAFLESKNIPALGIDLEEKEVHRAVSQGLQARQADGLEYLKSNDRHYRAIALIEVAEHIPSENLLHLLQAAVNKLQPGGILLIETINLRHPLAMQGFYTDPSHTRPLADDYLAFLLQWLGLEQVRIIYSSPAWLPGMHRDDHTRIYYTYAVIGTAPLTPQKGDS